MTENISEKVPTASVYTLGCKVNSYESTAISEKLRQYGFTVVSPDTPADVCIINTCAVTSEAERKSRQMIRRMHALSPNAYIIVTGCSAQADPGLISRIDGVDAVCGNRSKLDCAEAARELFFGKRKKAVLPSEKTASGLSLEDAEFEKMTVSSSERTRAVIKIEDGCENRCAYCIIPSLRGRIRSKAPDEVIAEAERLASTGYREIVLTGIEVSAYGRDLKEKDGLIGVVEKLGQIENIERIRLGSFDPSAVSFDFVDRAAKVPQFAHHFHLSLQSGCDRTLNAMRRRYSTDMVKKKVAYIREKMPDAMFTADIIVGFPGETDRDFEETREFLRGLGLLSFHIFIYSKRPGTEAAEMKDQVPPEKKAERMRSLEALRKEMSSDILGKEVGKTGTVIFEEYKEGLGAIGHTANFIETADADMSPDKLEIIRGKSVKVRFISEKDGIMFAETV